MVQSKLNMVDKSWLSFNTAIQNSSTPCRCLAWKRWVLLFSVHCQPAGGSCIETASSRMSEDQDVPKKDIYSNVGRGLPETAQRLVLHNYTHMGNSSTLPARKKPQKMSYCPIPSPPTAIAIPKQLNLQLRQPAMKQPNGPEVPVLIPEH